MLCAVIVGPTYDMARLQIRKAIEFANLVELRLDYFVEIDAENLQQLRNEFSIPIIFTIRSPIQGGKYKKNEESRLQEIELLAALKPDYFDIEYSIPECVYQRLNQQYPEIKWIISNHDFTETSRSEGELECLLQTMKKKQAFYYKIALHVSSTTEALKLVLWAKKNSPDLIIIGMGIHGQFTRIIGPILDIPITYASLADNEQTAPGQLTVQTLVERYHFHRLNKHTAIYGLIGDPVNLSVSDITHNHLMEEMGLNAVYLKLQLRKEQLYCLDELDSLGFQGLSVTMPLKEAILPYLNAIDSKAEQIGAVNTLLICNDAVKGFNTDGFGALNAIEKTFPVKEKKIIIIGAGGAAKSIAYEAIERGAIVTILNRNEEKAILCALELGCIGKGLNEMAQCASEGYDVLINSTPSSLPIDPNDILPNTLVMDIKTRPMETDFLKIAKKKGCIIVHGYQMFIEQALGQFEIWFEDRLPLEGMREVLEKKVFEVIS